MAGKNTSVFGIYQDRPTVESAVDMLQQAGFRNTDICVLFPYNEGTKDFATREKYQSTRRHRSRSRTRRSDRWDPRMACGNRCVAIPGLGPFIAAGPIMAALAGVGVGGAVGGLREP